MRKVGDWIGEDEFRDEPKKETKVIKAEAKKDNKE